MRKIFQILVYTRTYSANLETKEKRGLHFIDQWYWCYEVYHYEHKNCDFFAIHLRRIIANTSLDMMLTLSYYTRTF